MMTASSALVWDSGVAAAARKTLQVPAGGCCFVSNFSLPFQRRERKK